ncbi:AraC family transcriptional regulator [Spirillospora sp. CA-128828]|uniref:AraC family transcriptional regulator n=1 Tax=Spirillospora sp. CA-128828 TaxID=3240033 RepID=UPI003D8BF006
MAVGVYRVESANTADLKPGDRTDFWSELINTYNQSPMGFAYRRPDSFHGEAVRQSNGAYHLLDVRSDELTYVRTPRQIRRNPDPDYRFVVPLSGAFEVRQDGAESVLSPGTGGLMTLETAVEFKQVAGTRALIVTIPGHEVDGPMNRSSPVSAMVDVTRGLGRVVAEMLTGLAGERDGLHSRHFAAVCDRAVELLCMLAVGDDRPVVPGHLAEVEAMVRRHVRERVTDPGLTGASVARDLGWSLRQVQLALQHAGTTPRELIREERLRLARDRLTSPTYDHLSITDLAGLTGFSSASVFSTAFRRHYGATPREIRHDRDS